MLSILKDNNKKKIGATYINCSASDVVKDNCGTNNVSRLINNNETAIQELNNSVSDILKDCDSKL